MEDTERAALRGISRQLGRALSLTMVATLAGSRVEDEAIAAMDRAWESLADQIVDYAEGGE